MTLVSFLFGGIGYEIRPYTQSELSSRYIEVAREMRSRPESSEYSTEVLEFKALKQAKEELYFERIFRKNN